ncbi:MAG: hypothetical protein ACOCRX_10495 [Candidatus Woesearchaeota archaeon]
MKNNDLIFKNLEKWWHNNKRNFPWRETKDPYKILCAEIMLQKTSAEMVEDVFEKFIDKYPNVESLNEAEMTEVKKLLSTLGLHKRVDYLKKTADKIISKFKGKVPKSEENLLELTGVGSYTATAVLCFAYNNNKGVLDTNTIRILKRVFDHKSEKARARDDEKLQQTIDDIVKGNCRKYNYMLLDFGAKICKKRNPKCRECPIKDYCVHYSELN